MGEQCSGHINYHEKLLHMERGGFEPPTPSLPAKYSPTELTSQDKKHYTVLFVRVQVTTQKKCMRSRQEE